MTTTQADDRNQAFDDAINIVENAYDEIVNAIENHGSPRCAADDIVEIICNELQKNK